VLEDSCVRRLGGKNEIDVDVRVVAATNRNLEMSIKEGRLREDLYYRLNVFQIKLPPLRERISDIPALCEALISVLNRKHNTRVTDISREVLQDFEKYNWPGNVRELRNVLERAVILSGEGMIQRSHLPSSFGGRPALAAPPQANPEGGVYLPIGSTVDEGERALIEATLRHTKNNKTRAAEILGVSLKTLFNKLKEYGASEAEAGA
jgi:transcriptional regulator with PAS, ATPase and Fis domain